MIIKNEQDAVYTLLKNGVVVYVGKTTNIISRARQHQTDKEKDFDSIDVNWVLNDEINLIEFAYIIKYNPIYNKDLPGIDHSVRETAAIRFNRCMSNKRHQSDGFDLKSPDLTVTLRGRHYNLWAKKGELDEFNDMVIKINNIISNIKLEAQLLSMCNGLEDRR